ncbi:MAG: hypothetical protein QF718_04045 [Phycisphaerales bacterium]|jgi:hypothetical protein|nr:hypothetical protein [Phycisphaerales bacterium]
MSERDNSTQLDKSVLWLITHRVGSSWRCLFAEILTNELPSIVNTIEVDTDEALEILIQDKNPTKTFSVLPGSVTVCRTTVLPDVDNEQIQEILRLQAEAKLLGGMPSHRRAMAPLESSAGETNRVGLIVAWPENSSYKIPPCLANAHFVPDACSVASLLNGIRPTDPILLADPSDGTVTIALSHANGAALRAIKENSTTKSTFIESVLKTTKETANIHNHTTSFTDNLITKLQTSISEIESETPLLILPDEIIDSASKQIDGAPEGDKVWWRKWGISVGCLIAANNSLQPLTTMLYTAPEVNPSAVDRCIEKLSDRIFATRLVLVAILILALGPAVVSGVKLGLLKLIHPDIDAQYSLAVEGKKQQVVYRELGKTAWPMTKIIADITNNIPIGIDIESIRVDIGDPVFVRGRALQTDGNTAAELIAKMQDNLQSTGMFNEIQFSYETTGTYGDREFDLWATVTNPLKRPRYTTDSDFGVWTLAMRQDGTPPGEHVEEDDSNDHILDEDGSPLASVNFDSIPEETDTPAYLGDHKERERTDRPRARGGSSETQSHSEVRVSGGTSSRVPEPLTEGQIAVMTKSEATIALTEVSEALNHLKGDDESKERLRKEMHLLLARMKEIP